MDSTVKIQFTVPSHRTVCPITWDRRQKTGPITWDRIPPIRPITWDRQPPSWSYYVGHVYIYHRGVHFEGDSRKTALEDKRWG